MGATNEETDLYYALKELRDAILPMTDGRIPSADNLERYLKAIEWANAVIERTERSKRFEELQAVHTGDRVVVMAHAA